MLYNFECILFFIFDVSKQNNVFIFVTLCCSSSKVENVLKRLWTTQIKEERIHCMCLYTYNKCHQMTINASLYPNILKKVRVNSSYTIASVRSFVRPSVRRSHFCFLILLFFYKFNLLPLRICFLVLFRFVIILKKFIYKYRG